MATKRKGSKKMIESIETMAYSLLVFIVYLSFLKLDKETRNILKNIDKKLGVLINRLALQSMKEKE